MRQGIRHRYLTILLSVLASAVLAGVLPFPTPLDGPLFDVLLGIRALGKPGAERGDSPVAVVALDARSLDAPDLAQYPRTMLGPVWASALEGLFQAGARAIAFDFIFLYSANRLIPNYDAPFLGALNTHREQIVLGRSSQRLPNRAILAALLNDERALGLTEVRADPDGVYRTIRIREDLPGEGPVLTLAGALLARAGRNDVPTEVLLAPARHLEAIPTYSLVDVLQCARQSPEALARAFRGKLILIGTTLPEEDRKRAPARFLPIPDADGPALHPCGLHRLAASVPGAATVPGVYLHAAAAEAVLTGRLTTVAPHPLVAGLTALSGGAGAAIGLAAAPGWALILVTGLALVLLGTAVGLLGFSFWLPVLLPLAMAPVGAGAAYTVRYLIEERSRRRIQHAFSHYLSPAVVDRLAADPAALQLGGERRDVTVMFADLSGFTALSGKVEPEVLMRLTNEYLGYLVEAVEGTGGYVDKFIGDAVMALWGAPVPDPEHALHAVQAAQRAVTRIREAAARAAERKEPCFAVKIGLHSGPAVVGNVGTERRYNYTAIGETVNLAARLESIPGLYDCTIVLSARTAALVQGRYLLRELDTILVKGGVAPLTVFEPVAEVAVATPAQVEEVRRYSAALAAYRAGRFAEARQAWEALVASIGASGDGRETKCPAARLAARARAYELEPPPMPWDGVWVLKGK